MDFSLDYTDEQEEFAKEVREWLDENVPKDLESPRDILKMSYEQWQKRREIGRKLRPRCCPGARAGRKTPEPPPVL
jgi:hypothetical protein